MPHEGGHSLKSCLVCLKLAWCEDPDLMVLSGPWINIYIRLQVQDPRYCLLCPLWWRMLYMFLFSFNVKGLGGIFQKAEVYRSSTGLMKLSDFGCFENHYFLPSLCDISDPCSISSTCWRYWKTSAPILDDFEGFFSFSFIQSRAENNLLWAGF